VYDFGMSTITTRELVADPQAFITRLEAGEALTVSKDGTIVAEVIPAWKPLAKPRPFGLCQGEFVVADDFNDPLPEDILLDWEGRDA
jgi:antitoxin (DNA-binding transcriptional repressor) of toxin-antitoxin stability system